MRKTSIRLTNPWYSPILLLLLLTACSGGGKSNPAPLTYAPGLAPQAPSAPASLTAAQGDGFITLTWPVTSGAPSYNLYWSTRSGVTVSSGTKISSVTSPQIHGGLTNGTGPYYYIVTAVGSAGEGPASTQAVASPANGATLADPLFTNQWHLNNTTFTGEDIKVIPVWNTCGTGNTCRGEGIRIALVDDGLEIKHEDLSANVATGFSYNYVDNTNDPTGGEHGSSVAGVVAARDLNGLGVRGVAPRANLVAYNFLAASTVSNAADAEIRGTPDVHIYNNSWGPPDGQGALAASDSLWNIAIAYGLVNGRGGKGSIYLWAGGNGAAGDRVDPASSNYCPTCVDNSNYDGYANHHGVIAVCAVGSNGLAAYYSEAGANLLLCAPSSDTTIGITTTDRSGALGSNASGAPDYPDLNYTNAFGGTSSATPTVAGVVALMLQANPNLGWRDVRKILADTARVNNPLDSGPSGPEWTTNGAGYPVNHRYGFGVVDATAAVTAARTWTNLGPELSYTSAFSTSTSAGPSNAIPDNNTTGISSSINVTGSGITKIETVEVTFSANHPRSGDLEITLTSPMGAKSILATRHDCVGGNTGCSAYSGWVFSSVRHLNETADGIWSLTVKDLAPPAPPASIFTDVYTGTFQSWRLKIYGRAT